MWTLIKLNFRQIKDIFFFAYAVEAIFILINQFIDDISISMIHGIWLIIISTMLVYFTIQNMMKFYNFNEDIFMHLVPQKQEMILAIKCITSLILVYGFFLITLLYNFLNSHIEIGQVFINLGMKIISLITFYIFIYSLIILIKPIKNIKFGIILGIFILFIVTVFQVIVFLKLNPNINNQWIIGASLSKYQFQQYMNIIPLTIFKRSSQFEINSYVVYGLISNIIIILMSFINIFFNLKYIKRNFI